MKIVVTANGRDLDAKTSPVFGRCPTFVFVDTDTMAFEAVDNPAVSASGGAGVQAAQFIAGHGAEAAVSGSFGPNAFNTLDAGGIAMYALRGDTVRDVVEHFNAGQLSHVTSPGQGARRGMGRGRRGR